MYRAPLFMLAIVVLLAAPQTARAASALDPALESMLSKLRPHGAAQADVDAASRFVAAHPDDPAGYAVRCLTRANVSDATQEQALSALEDCKHAISMRPSDGFVHLVTGDVAYDFHDYKLALSEYNAAVAAGQKDRGIFWKRCDARRFSGDLTGALADCEAAVRLDPQAFAPMYTLGRLQVERKNFRAAVDALTTALARKPGDINALYWRGVSYGNLDQPQKAELDLTRCIELGDTSPDTYYQRGWMRMNLHDKPGARSDWETAATAYRKAGIVIQADIVEALLKKVDSL